jgi:hypothetical protein
MLEIWCFFPPQNMATFCVIFSVGKKPLLDSQLFFFLLSLRKTHFAKKTFVALYASSFEFNIMAM